MGASCLGKGLVSSLFFLAIVQVCQLRGEERRVVSSCLACNVTEETLGRQHIEGHNPLIGVHCVFSFCMGTVCVCECVCVCLSVCMHALCEGYV